MGTACLAFAEGEDSSIYSRDNTGPWHKLGVVALSDKGEAITSFDNGIYYGGFECAYLGGWGISVNNVVSVEHYVKGVVGAEMLESWPVEALKAQAVCARTIAQRNARNTDFLAKYGFDFTNDTRTQAYSGATRVGNNIIKAVEETKGEVIVCDGSLISAMYFSCSGGGTEDSENVYGYGVPWLRGKIDYYEPLEIQEIAGFYWSRTYSGTELGKTIGMGLVTQVSTTYSKTGNVISMTFTDIRGNSKTINGGNAKGILMLSSMHYSVSRNNDGSFCFSGAGVGHNLGMSQYGAKAMAEYYGKTYGDILGFYYSYCSLQHSYLC